MQHAAKRIKDGGKSYEINAVLSDDGRSIIAATAQYYDEKEERFLQIPYGDALEIAQRNREKLFHFDREETQETYDSKTRDTARGFGY